MAQRLSPIGRVVRHRERVTRRALLRLSPRLKVVPSESILGMEWGFDRRFALGGLAISIAIAIAGLGVTILWPDKKELGWALLWAAAVIFFAWVAFEIFQWRGLRWTAFLLSAITACVVFGGLAALQREANVKNEQRTPTSQPQVTTNQPRPPSSTVTPPAAGRPRAPTGSIAPPGARLLMSKALIIALKNSTTSARGFGVNFVYANRGPIPTTGQVHADSVVVSEEPLPRGKIMQLMKEVSAFKASPELQKGGDEIYPNDPNERFFSVPDGDKKIAQLAPLFDDVVDGRKRVYFFVTIKFRDKSMRPSVVGVSETCGWFLKQLDVVHNCGVDRLYSEVEK